MHTKRISAIEVTGPGHSELESALIVFVAVINPMEDTVVVLEFSILLIVEIHPIIVAKGFTFRLFENDYPATAATSSGEIKASLALGAGFSG